MSFIKILLGFVGFWELDGCFKCDGSRVIEKQRGNGLTDIFLYRIVSYDIGGS
jgi:hypothetical protein